MPFITLTMVHPKKLKVGPCLVNVNHVRAAYPRHYEPGTRLTFRDGRGVAVLEKFADVCAMLGQPVQVNLADPGQAVHAVRPTSDSIKDYVEAGLVAGKSVDEIYAAISHRASRGYVTEVARKYRASR